MTGYDLARFFDQSTAWVWSAPHSNIYTELRKLEREGLVEGRKEIRGERLERTVYSVTDAGLDDLRTWTAAVVPTGPERDALVLRSVFFDLVEVDAATKVLEAFLSDQRRLIDDWTEHRDALLAKETPLIQERLARRPPSQHDHIAALKAHVFQGMIDVAKARIDWAERGIALLQQRPPADDVTEEGLATQ